MEGVERLAREAEAAAAAESDLQACQIILRICQATTEDEPSRFMGSGSAVLHRRAARLIRS